MVRFFSIVLLCIGASVLYGLVHDQITIRICPEYFTILHPKLFGGTLSLTLLAMVWGVIATWWVGLILGIILACACCLGERPKLEAAILVRPIGKLLLVMAVIAALAGVTGYYLTWNHTFTPSRFFVEVLPHDAILGAITDKFTHLASYGAGFVGGIVLSIWAWIRRGTMSSPV